MTQYLLDTETCVSYLKEKHFIPEKIESVGINNCFLSEVTIIELTYGAYHSQRIEKHLSEIDRVKLLYKVIPIEACIEQFAKEKVRLRRMGQLIADFDLLIGTTAVARNMVMVTDNLKHFKRIKDIEIENWRDAAFNEFL